MKVCSLNFRPFLLIAALAGVVTAFSGCGGKDDPAVPDSKVNAKFTISVAGFVPAEGDFVQVAIVGTTVNGTETTLWKLNGAVQNNVKGIMLRKEELAAGATMVVESAIPLYRVEVTVTAINSATPFTFKMKNEINGQPKEDINTSVTGEYRKDWSY